MPNRILSEDILLCEPVAMLRPQAEVFYRRLMSVVDDFGRFDARPAVLRGRLYALKLDTVDETSVEDWLQECEEAGLVQTYTSDGKPFLLVMRMNAPRAKASLYPPPPGEDGFTRDQIRSDSYVYFIWDYISEAVKIGSSVNPDARLRELQTANPNPLTLLGFTGGGLAKEAELHRRFAAQRIRPDSEWFYVKGALADYLSSIRLREESK